MFRWMLTFIAVFLLTATVGNAQQATNGWFIFGSMHWLGVQHNLSVIPNKVIESDVPGNIKVWIKAEPVPDSTMSRATQLDMIRKWIDQNGERKRITADGFENYTHTLMLFELNCSRQTYRVVTNHYMGNNGFIEKRDNPSFIFDDIPPGSVIEDVSNQVCK